MTARPHRGRRQVAVTPTDEHPLTEYTGPVRRVAGLFADLPSRWDEQRVMLIGHLATYRALEHVANRVTVEDIVTADFTWRPEGWEYRLG